MIKIAFYTKHQLRGASSRYRTVQYLDECPMAWAWVQRPLFSDRYLEVKYATGRTPIFRLFYAYLRRFLYLFIDVLTGHKFVVEKEFFPYFPPFAEWCLSTLRIGYVLDYDDAVWHNYDQNRHWLIRLLLGRKLAWVVRWSRGVICGNHYIEQYVRSSGQMNTVIIPTVVPLQKYASGGFNRDRFVIAWIGSPSSSKNVLHVAGALSKFVNSTTSSLKLVGFDSRFMSAFDCSAECITWTEVAEREVLADCDVGIMPLDNGAFEKGKCGFKIVQYMAAGKPAIASNVGCNSQIILNGETGFLVDETMDWENCLQALYADFELRVSLGLAARERFEEAYSLESQLMPYFTFIEKSLFKRVFH